MRRYSDRAMRCRGFSRLVHSTSAAPRPQHENTLSLYVHWPYCVKICPYCDFNRYLNDNVDHGRMSQSYLSELKYFLDLRKDAFGTPPRITSIFFGGGTPSLAKPETFHKIIGFAREHAESVENEKLKDFKQAGINRLSMGIQALNDDDLRFLGRAHNLKEALRALEISAQLFERRNFDLIYARHPRQTLEDWRKEVKMALEFSTGHLSMYSLTIEPGTPFSRLVQKGEHDDIQASMFDIAIEETEKAGYRHYEISNYAFPGHESRHNLNYWLGGDYIGIGPGASGRLFLKNGTREAFLQKKNPLKWMEGTESRDDGGKLRSIQDHMVLTEAEQTDELLLSGLRIPEGVSRATFARFSPSKPIEKFFKMDALRRWQSEGMLQLDSDGLRLTQEGRKLLDTILPDIL